MFENLTEKLQRTFKNRRGQGKLTEEHLDAALAEIREAMLEGDVALPVIDELLGTIRSKALGIEVMLQLSPDQQVIKIVRDELTTLLGKHAKPLFASRPPSVWMIVGLPGAGKTSKAPLRLPAAFGVDDCRLARLRQNHYHGKTCKMARAARPSPDRRFHSPVSPHRR